ncbi:MAG: hypothetical protein R2708_12505 [Vicinamibacterales bacterium]
MSCTVTTVGVPVTIGIMPLVKCATSGRISARTRGAYACIQTARTDARCPSNTRTSAGSGASVSIARFEMTTSSSPVRAASRARCCSRCSV